MDVEEKLNHAKNGAAKFAMEAKTKGYLVGLIQFDSSATHLCEPQKELSVLHQHLRSMEASGNTNMTDAILLATEKLMNKKGARVMVVATDGVPDNPDSALEAGQQAKKSGIEIITIGTDDADRDFLRKLASRPEFGTKVSSVQLEQAIASVAKMLLSKRGG
jgi:Mg-chelatase subunit ChlD